MRKQANEIDSWASPYKAIVSVLMLKEGWDVRNVTTIVGLRAYAAKSKLLPEQTLGRGLRRMYFGYDRPERVAVMGTPAFMEFVESIQSEGVTFERIPMGPDMCRKDSLVVEIETDNPDKKLDELDIKIPKFTRRFNREYKDIDILNPAKLGNKRIPLQPFTPEQTREIIFKTMLDSEIDHTILLDGDASSDYRSAIAFFTRQLLKELRLVGGYDVLYPKIKVFVAEYLFEMSPVNLEDPVVLRNLSEPNASKILFDSFTKAINSLTVQESGTSRIEAYIRLRDMRPFRTEYREYLTPRKSLFSKIVGEPHSGGFELIFAAFLDNAPDVAAFTKNYLAIGFKIDYVKTNGELSNYVPDFIVKTTDGTVWIIETKGREELELPQKMKRLRQWCVDATSVSKNEEGPAYHFVYVNQSGFEIHKPTKFAALITAFTGYQQD